MTLQIRHDGKVFNVHTEVGDGLTRVVFDEAPPHPPTDARATQRINTPSTTNQESA